MFPKLHAIEIAVMDQISLESDPPVIYDVGAHHGAFALEAKKRWPNALITCFEANPYTFRTLYNNVSDFANTKAIALSDEYSKVPLYYDDSEDMTASLHKRNLNYKNISHGAKTVQVHTNKLSDYIINDKVIDFLKVDVEGHEYKVLLGAEQYLRPEIIKNIQLEFNSCNLDSRIFFKDFWDLLHPLGYKISTTPDFEPIEEYSPKLEDFDACREILVRL